MRILALLLILWVCGSWAQENKNSTVDSNKNEIKTAEVKSNEVRMTEVKPNEVKMTEVKPNEVKTVEVTPNEVKTGEVKPNEVKTVEVTPNEVKTGEVKPNEVKTIEVKPYEVKTSEVKPNEVKTVEVTPNEVKTGEVKPNEVKTTTESPKTFDIPPGCVCGIYLSGQIKKGSKEPPKGNPALLHEHGEIFPCTNIGNKLCTNKCLDTIVKHLPNSPAILCGSIDRDAHKERAYLFIKNCKQEWINTNFSAGREYCCKNGVSYKCPIMR